MNFRPVPHISRSECMSEPLMVSYFGLRKMDFSRVYRDRIKLLYALERPLLTLKLFLHVNVYVYNVGKTAFKTTEHAKGQTSNSENVYTVIVF